MNAANEFYNFVLKVVFVVIMGGVILFPFFLFYKFFTGVINIMNDSSIIVLEKRWVGDLYPIEFGRLKAKHLPDVYGIRHLGENNCFFTGSAKETRNKFYTLTVQEISYFYPLPEDSEKINL